MTTYTQINQPFLKCCCWAYISMAIAVYIFLKYKQQKWISKAWFEIKKKQDPFPLVFCVTYWFFCQIYFQRLVHCPQPKMKFIGVQMKFIGKYWYVQTIIRSDHYVLCLENDFSPDWFSILSCTVKSFVDNQYNLDSCTCNKNKAQTQGLTPSPSV